MLIDEVAHILADPAHWIGHVAMDAVWTSVVLYPLAKWRVRAHDRKVHRQDTV